MQLFCRNIINLSAELTDVSVVLIDMIKNSGSEILMIIEPCFDGVLLLYLPRNNHSLNLRSAFADFQ